MKRLFFRVSLVAIAGIATFIGFTKTNEVVNNDFLPLEVKLDLNSFDLGTLSGSIRMLDLNYENFLHSNIVIMDNKIKSWAGEGLSQELRDKYNQPQFKQLATQTSAVAQREHPIYGLCDTNHNHNVSFSECYKCVSDAIEADGFSSWVCDIPILGWLSCWGTTTATCVIIAGAY